MSAEPAPPAAFYRYSRDRKARAGRALLGTCRGFLHADGYAGFNRPFMQSGPKSAAPRLIKRTQAEFMRAAKFTTCHVDTGSPRWPKAALERIAELFAIEARHPSGRPTGRAP